MIELLKSGRINTVLLCEMAAHPDFVKLLADMEIYVDGIAAAQIQNLNAWVDVVRAEIMDKYQPGEHDKTMYLLKAAHVQEGEYFSRRVHDDIDGILEDIKTAHRGRSESSPETSVAAELKRDLDEAANFKGSRLEQLIFLFCKQTKLRYNKLTEEEKGWLVPDCTEVGAAENRCSAERKTGPIAALFSRSSRAIYSPSPQRFQHRSE